MQRRLHRWDVACDPEVREVSVAVFVEQDVPGLDAAMDDALPGPRRGCSLEVRRSRGGPMRSTITLLSIAGTATTVDPGHDAT